MRALVLCTTLLFATPALAGSASTVLGVNVKPQALVVNTLGGIAADCNWQAGQFVAQPMTSGGNGAVIKWTMTGSTDFVINNLTGEIDVGPNGIAPADCGKTINVTPLATQ